MRVAVDRRVELFSILFHVAGTPDYGQAFHTPYLRDLDAHFAPFASHPAVEMTREMRRAHGISYNAPLTLAIQLDDALRPAGRLSPLPAGVDARWKDAPVDEYVARARDFAEASDLEGFLRAESAYTSKVEQAFRDFLADKPVLAWFDGVFGRRANATYLVAPGLLTGKWNYGLHAVRPDGAEVVVQVMNLEGADANGLPHPGETTHGLLAHELAHTYVNPIVEARLDALKDVALPAFESVHEAMARQTYGTETIFLDESVVRAVTVLYLRENAGEDAARRSLAEQRALSFLWTDDLARAIDDVRKKNGGKVSEAELVDATRAVFAKR